MSDTLLGYGGALVAIVCFGSYGVPTKIVPTGDGMVYQWIVCCGVLFVGLIVQYFVPHEFEWLASVGGMVWALGNTTVVPVVKIIGLGLGMLTWGVSNLVTGWTCGYFGIFVDKDDIPSRGLNAIGALIAAGSLALYYPVKATVKDLEKEAGEKDDLEQELLRPNPSESSKASTPAPATSNGIMKAVGFVTALFAGVLYGGNMIPVVHLQDKYKNASPLAFAASHFIGIFLASTAVLVVYCIYKKNKPEVYRESILPAFFSGILWACAQCGWFVANEKLGLTVAFPIITTGPGIIANLWGVIYFKEIQGTKNLAWLGSAFACTVLGIALITVSHKVHVF